MNYTLNQLQIFLKIVQTQSITKASEELQLTQPAVSIQLKNFQDQFDIPLTEMIGRKIFITDFGKEIAVAVEDIIDQVNAINSKTLAYKGLLTGKLKISVVSTGKYVMPHFLADFMKMHAGVELSMEVDLALVSILPTNVPIEKLDLLQNKLFLVGDTKESFSKPIPKKDIFKKAPFIYRENGSGTRQLMEKYMEDNKLSVFKKMELTSNEAVKQALIAGLGYSIMPLIGIRNELFNKELQIIPVKGLPIKTTWSLIWLKGKNHSPASSALLTYLKESKSDIVREKFNWYEQY
jgi:DNA-binding transcriptional LysR family regulator